MYFVEKKKNKGKQQQHNKKDRKKISITQSLTS